MQVLDFCKRQRTDATDAGTGIFGVLRQQGDGQITAAAVTGAEAEHDIVRREDTLTVDLNVPRRQMQLIAGTGRGFRAADRNLTRQTPTDEPAHFGALNV